MGAGSSVPYQDNMKVVIVGGGYVGAYLAYLLKKSNFCKIVLIDPKDAMFHSIGALRATVQEDFGPKLFLPYDKMLGDIFMRGKVVEVRPTTNEVVLEDGKIVSYTHLVIATGTTNPFPGKITGLNEAVSTDEGIQAYKDYYNELKSAKNVVLVGGGAVGVEMAGELKAELPETEVTIINSPDYLLSSRTSKNLQTALNKALAKKGINVLKGERVSNLNELTLNKLCQGQKVQTQSGKEIEADFVIPCTGTKPNNQSFKDQLATSMTDHGVLQVDEYLKVKGQSKIYAIGDINDTAEEKMCYTGQLHADLLAANFKAEAQNKNPKPHKPATFAMLVPLGRSGGVGELMGMILGDFAVRKGKSEELFTKKTWSAVGLKAPA